MNNYQGSTFNNKNLINVYGFLEYDLSDGVRACLDNNAMGKSILTKRVDAFGNVGYFGNDMYFYKIVNKNLVLLYKIFDV